MITTKGDRGFLDHLADIVFQLAALASVRVAARWERFLYEVAFAPSLDLQTLR